MMSKNANEAGVKAVGLTAAAGYQIGVRRTIPWTQEQTWDFLTSQEGLRLWLGEVPQPAFQKGESFQSSCGISGEFRVVRLHEQVRLQWQRSDMPVCSTLQIRLLPTKSGGTTVSFHQEKLGSLAEREAMKLHWESALEAIIAKSKED